MSVHKEPFQAERVAFFSDAVFAIAITLLIIEVKVPEPESHEITDHVLWEALAALIPKFIGFLVSFFVIGLYWLSHHRLFRYVHKVNAKLTWANILFLLPIVIMPFSSGFLSEYYNGLLRAPLIIYTLNIFFAGMMSYRLWKIAGNSKYGLTVGLSQPILKYNLARAMVIPVSFVVIMLASYISMWIAYVTMPLLPLLTTLIKKHFLKKYPQQIADHIG